MIVYKNNPREDLVNSFMYLALCGLALTLFFSFILLCNYNNIDKIEKVIVGLSMLIAEIAYYLMKAVDLPKHENRWI